MAQQCQWRGSGHTCHPNACHFLLRYGNETDYCVGGRRLTLSDDGQLTATCEPTTPAQARQLELWLLDQWVGYLTWRVANRYRLPNSNPQPILFSFPIRPTEEQIKR